MSALGKAVKAGKKAAAKAAPKVAPAVSQAMSPIDELLYKLSKKPGDPALTQAIMQAAANNPAMQTKIGKFGIGPKAHLSGNFPSLGAAGSGTPRSVPNPAKGPFTPSGGTGLGKLGKLGVGLGAGTAGVMGINALLGPAGQEGASASPASGGFDPFPGLDSVRPSDAIGDYDTSFDASKMPPSPISSAVTRGGSGGRVRPSAPKPAMSSGLTGQNGVKDISSMIDFGTDDVDFEGMFRNDFERPIPQAPEEKKGGGMGNMLKTLGPLLAALFAGKMMG